MQMMQIWSISYGGTPRKRGEDIFGVYIKNAQVGYMIRGYPKNPTNEQKKGTPLVILLNRLMHSLMIAILTV